MKRIFLGLLIVCLLASASLAAAQDSTWEVVFLEPDNERLIYVTVDGIVREVPMAGISALGTVRDARLSPDGTLLMISATNAEGANVYVAEAISGTCCARLFSPSPAGADIVLLGPFSQDGTQAVAMHAKLDAGGGVAAGASAFVAIYDLASGQIVETLPTASLPADGGPPAGAIPGNWTEAGIELAPSSLEANRETRVQYVVWNPADGSITPGGGVNEAFGSEWVSTNEMIVSERDDNYPVGETQLDNVLRYYADSSVDSQPITIYARAGIFEADWVLGGEAIYVRHATDDETYMLFRDGGLAPIQVAQNSTYLAATPDGWLLRDADALLYYSFDDGVLNTFELARIGGPLRVVRRAEYGTPSDQSFPSID